MMTQLRPPARVSVVIPTFRRPYELLRAMHSVFRQTYLEGALAELVIVDNDPSGSSMEPARLLAAEAPASLRVTILHCPDPGVANARNMAVDAVTTPLIAFLDDDQSAPATWLAELVQAHSETAASVVFGPVDTALPNSIHHHRAYFQAFFARNPDLPDGLIPTFFGCGNALLDLRQLPAQRPLFDAATNETGGEDDNLFSRIQRQGARFAWASRARVWEHVPANRATLDYTLRRALAYGQGPSRMAREGGDYSQLAFWMAVGLGQFIVYGLTALVGWAVRAPTRAIWLGRATQGLGKLVWWPKHRFYGASQTAPAAPTSDQSMPPPAEPEARQA
ncbi:MAG: glycosyltransferase [Hyphomonadaceae bacterium]|nr:glycosyltransferase [Hyphomonadaceae bacterium]